MANSTAVLRHAIQGARLLQAVRIWPRLLQEGDDEKDPNWQARKRSLPSSNHRNAQWKLIDGFVALFLDALARPSYALSRTSISKGVRAWSRPYSPKG